MATSCSEGTGGIALALLILLGDFNHSDICWKSSTASCRQSRRLLQCIEDNFLSQVINSPARGDAILDLMVTNATAPHKKDGDRLFTRACCDRTRGNGFKLKEGRFRLEIKKKFFTTRVVKHCNRLPREVVDAPSLDTFKVRLDGALRNVIKLKMSLLIAGGLD
ncbi:hypothetical protein QYF61_003158 [Mycteria americana]|uniref:Secreted protein n=1 Tax=Mycteria americana TaxID=33587 RepID=A0AAN7NHB2_MYCAM|nr:hypothetical protein QYF61_003158 [Mycteria americana]